MKKLALLLLTLVLLTLPAWAYAEPSGVREHRTEERREPLETEGAALMADGSATINVTACLPVGPVAKAGDEVRIYLYTPAEIDSSGRVIQDPVPVKNKKAHFQQGTTSTAVVFENVAEGKYILCGHVTRMDGGQILNARLYYHSDGSLTSSQYTATPFHVSAGENVTRTIAIPEADASISGELTFSSPLPQNTDFRLYCGAQGRNSTSCTVYFTGQKGAVSVPFSIGLISGAYSLEFFGESGYYLDYDGTLAKQYGKRYYCHILPGMKFDDLSINGDILLIKPEEPEPETETVEVNISVALPEALGREKEFAVCAVYREEEKDDYLYTKSSRKTVEIGQNTFSGTLTLDKDKEYAIGYRDTTYCDSVYSPDATRDVRYISANGGITTLYENAKKFRFLGNGFASVQEPACGRVAGYVDRNGFNAELPETAYAYAVFPDGERYCARVPLGSDASAGYVIYVPLRHNGQTFELSAAMARDNSNEPLNASFSTPVSMLFNGNVSAENIAVSGDYVAVSGKVSLPDGLKAHAGGHAIQLEAQYNQIGRYIIPAGQNHVAFSLHHYRDGRSVFLRAHLIGALSGVYDSVSQDYSLASADEADEAALVFPASAVISGTVSLAFPFNVRDVGARLELCADLSGTFSTSVSSYIGILKGRSFSRYTLTVPVGKLSELRLRPLSSTEERVKDNTLYADGEWNITKERSDGPAVTDDRSDVDFTLDVYPYGVTPQVASVKAYAEDEKVFDYLRSNGHLYAICGGREGITTSIIAAVYDEQGRFLTAATSSYVSLTRNGTKVSLWFDPQKASDATAIRVFMFAPETREPMAGLFKLNARRPPANIP